MRSGREDLLYRGGLKIYTTLDPKVQAEAEATVAETVDGVDPRTSDRRQTGAEIEHILQMSITAVEPPTGFVRALVGGRDFNLPTGQANLADAVPARPVASPARRSSRSCWPRRSNRASRPDAVYSGGPLTIGDYSPQNYGGAELRAA